jgi:hypothetical protein
MVSIILKDTGIIKPNYTTPTAFTDQASATTANFQAGEFTVTSAVTLKVTGFNAGISTNNQDLPSTNNTFTSNGRLSTAPVKFSLTVLLVKPNNWNTTDIKDLGQIRDLALMTLSKGHKDLYVDDSVNADRELLLSLRQWMYSFGKTDTGSGSSQRHLNVRLDSLSQNESPKQLSLNLNFTLLWDLSTRE